MTARYTRLADALPDRYRIERELGAGGMATVFVAHDLRDQRDVAIKVMKPEVSGELAGVAWHRTWQARFDVNFVSSYGTLALSSSNQFSVTTSGAPLA